MAFRVLELFRDSSGGFRDYFKMYLAFRYNELLFKSGLDYCSENIKY